MCFFQTVKFEMYTSQPRLKGDYWRPSETDEHYHVRAEELYHFVSGAGRMRLGKEEEEVAAGDCVVIPPGVNHKLWNPGTEALVLLCCCAPPYRHGDTVMTGG